MTTNTLLITSMCKKTFIQYNLYTDDCTFIFIISLWPHVRFPNQQCVCYFLFSLDKNLESLSSSSYLVSLSRIDTLQREHSPIKVFFIIMLLCKKSINKPMVILQTLWKAGMLSTSSFFFPPFFFFTAKAADKILHKPVKQRVNWEYQT